MYLRFWLRLWTTPYLQSILPTFYEQNYKQFSFDKNTKHKLKKKILSQDKGGCKMLMKWTPGLMWWVETGAVSRSVRKTSSISRLNSGIAASVVPNTSKIWPLAVPRSRIAEYKTQYLWRNIFFFHCLSKQINFNVSKNLEECMHSFDKFVWNAVVMKRPRNDQFISEHVSRENLPNFRGIAVTEFLLGWIHLRFN